MAIHLTNLTPEQVEMLNIIWSLDTVEDFTNWVECLDEQEQDLALALQELVMIEAMEQSLKDFSQAQQYLKKFML